MPRISAKFAIVIGAMTAVFPTILLALDISYLCFVPFMLGLFCVSVGSMSLGSGRKIERLVGWSALALSTFAIVFPFGAIAIFNRPGHDIVYIIPDGYRGPIRLLIDKDRGLEIPLENDKYIYHLRQDGTLIIKDPNPFYRWHSTAAYYQNGERIAVHLVGDSGTNVVSLRGGGSGSDWRDGRETEYFYDFVGTINDWNAYSPSKRGNDE